MLDNINILYYRGIMKLSEIKPNPNNPRYIEEGDFQKLVKSITEFPKMMELRPMVIDSDNVVMGGNMRLKALGEMGLDEVPEEWIKRADDLTPDEVSRFIIADNVGFGKWNYDVLANEWDPSCLIDWGVDLPEFDVDVPENTPIDNKEKLCPHCGGVI